ncbi:decaprenylphosphoryl-beta-D-ribose oxidase [Pseudonocardia sp. EC080610-09]|uniref:FAD-binding protein n=1 Tax=unclassified Pseudonocardia TaxID=2619320 RepID=UPI0006CB52C7|nr:MULTISPECIES: FAD-binding oxidoreductase [unclassified Pseudonocardia]ALE75425.1 decaprenylphosphoryl-beta-D-ribose oxidase [Pseudonocardia sp. EC080625-04]ALL74790.1 decaprenylphosphoryl-beta-D-ribose oxidase [Pseudonocardia sp. EC080610-09]ALL81813.1 decaprenylphosphoryl-beta-D-ribose oxidase [Pseudonocardia sp. EC080619-01]
MTDTTVPTSIRTDAPARRTASLHGWGRTAPTLAQLVTPRGAEDVAEAVRTAGDRGIIARGLGRSYGDPAQNAGGVVLDMPGMNRIHAIDEGSGVADVDAGVSLDQLMRAALPLGLWVPVLPGTRQVTIGGAIGADVHGKNHHTKGSFGNHVEWLQLVTADGSVKELTPDGPEKDLFWATVGGMGLTGVVVRAKVRLHRTESAYFVVDTDRTDDLDGLLELLTDGSDDTYGYSAAWFDTTATGARTGRSVLTRGSLATVDQLPEKLRAEPLKFDAPQLLTFPDVFPNGLANKLSLTAFSELWFRKAPRRQRGAVQNITAFYQVLDLFGEWNRIFGSKGFLQYQFVVPMGEEAALRRIVERITRSPHKSGLNVFKRFGDGNDAPLSFPTKGWTITVDFPIAPGLSRFCTELDELVLAAGGRLYLAKESRTSPEAFAAGYPRFDEWKAIRDAADPAGVFASDMSRRLSLAL